ncbi:fructose bisphosphate aldolase [Microbacterium candidum]|uniref:fructose-bisphosphate aldolase n=1 Tax=Microbacterium candidum TaxID=3041922 RepID=A0ABT7MVQ7_9MICO|nr:fructose bisphosphate aldolase [Microbacterium sp. ASV49]MDL9978539.1 fructose bisphosphate aldolase [Microbacterium sp. ASV49]
MTDLEQLSRFTTGRGFVAALDQSGGSSPGALRAYGVDPAQYATEAEMFDLIQAMRARVISNPAFGSDRIIGTILFTGTLDRTIDGRSVADYLWQVKGVVPFLKIDAGLEDTADGVQLMRDAPSVGEAVKRGQDADVFGTKARSVIHAADPVGIARIVDQQFALAERVLDAGLLPIMEPEVDITIPDRAAAESLLKEAILARLDGLGERQVAVKVSIPVVDDFYADLIAHPRIARVVALSGGYTQAEAIDHLARNHGLIASFSRALLEGLRADQSDEEFGEVLAASIDAIYRASVT